MRRYSFAITAAVAAALSVPAGAFATVPPVDSVDTSAIVAQRVGGVSVVDADRRGVVLGNGGSTSEFSLSLPRDASCPGDSRNDNWRVQTFIVPHDVDPSSIKYGENGPTGTHQWAFYDITTSPVIEGLLLPNDKPGAPGRVADLPSMSFRVFPVGEIPPGTYRAGVACTWFGATGPYWDTEIVFAADPKDEPAQISWTVPGAPQTSASAAASTSSPPWTAILLAISAIGFGSAFLLGRKPKGRSHA